MNKNKIIILGGHGENDSLNGLMRGYIPLFETRGFEVFNYNLSDPNWNKQQLLELLRSTEVLFALTYLGFGQTISIVTEENSNSKNIWEFFNVPLLKWHGDSPAYLPERHNWKCWIALQSCAITRIIQPFVLYDTPILNINRKQRLLGKLVFFKTGGDINEMIARWKQKLPNTICKLLENMCETLTSKYMQSSVVLIGDLVANFLKERGISEQISPPLFHFLATQLDDYFRRIRSTLVANSLLDFPVIIQGRGWEHIDFSNAKANYMPPRSYVDSTDIFLNQFGIIDMSPNTSSSPYDRIWRAAGSHSLCITNKQTWFNKFLGFENLSYEFNKESIQETIHNILRISRHGNCL